MPIAIVSVPVRDAAASLRFYRDVMGFALIRDEPMGEGVRWIQLQPPGGGATITLVGWFEAMPPGSMQGLLLDVADIDAEHRRLSAQGASLSPIAEEPWGRSTTLRDPDGNGWVVASLTATDGAAG